MAKRIQDLFEYVFGPKKLASVCRLRIYDTEDKVVAIFSDVPGNPGADIWKACEVIAMKIVKDYNLDPLKTNFIAHNPQRKVKDGDSDKLTEEKFEQVYFHWHKDNSVTSPNWAPRTREQIEKLVGTLD